MRFLFILCILIGFNACKTVPKKNNITFANNPVIAHRGAWKANNLPENSIASLKRAMALNCTGSEFDVRMTSDHILIVAHDANYNNLVVEESTYAELSKHKLSNGETIPTLKQYLLAGMQNNTSTGLVCEIKPSKIEGRNVIIAEKVIKLVKELKAEPFILTYISFSYEILIKVKELDKNAKTQYLDGSKTPEQLKEDGINGLDYAVFKIKRNPEWIESAKNHGLLLNTWTANTTEDMDWLLANDFDFITTDEPELLFERIKKSPTKQGYKLVWSDEFNYKGIPDSTKWTYEHGFIANNEKQYYVDSLKNARVENGHLIIEAHKEKVANKDFKNPAIKDWMRYKREIDSAQYTSARIKTEGLASWQYGRIEVSAKLPKGRGMWPAIWMLSENRKNIGWPESGEIDIMEQVGYDNDTIHGTIHTKAYNHLIGTQKGKTIFIDKPNDTFHVFALEWTPEKMDFILDGVVYNHIVNEHKTTAEWPFDQKFHLILNVAVGGMWGGQKGIDDAIFPQKMVIDYVRVFQKE
ncbi:family 16 glycosylhydrolase [Mariniflexile sp.]|uniref:family 16 glycosylhydrolase n=1 Tax=Mariniflexile sp. TaxID=1979402 RepID=UPI0040484C58